MPDGGTRVSIPSDGGTCVSMFMYLVTSLVRVAEVPGHVEVTAGFDRCSPFSPEADL